MPMFCEKGLVKLALGNSCGLISYLGTLSMYKVRRWAREPSGPGEGLANTAEHGVADNVKQCREAPVALKDMQVGASIILLLAVAYLGETASTKEIPCCGTSVLCINLDA